MNPVSLCTNLPQRYNTVLNNGCEQSANVGFSLKKQAIVKEVLWIS